MDIIEGGFLVKEISALLKWYYRLPSLSLTSCTCSEQKQMEKQQREEAVYEWGKVLLSVTRTYHCLHMCACCFSCVHLLHPLWTVATGPLSIRFSGARILGWVCHVWPLPEDLFPTQGMQPRSLSLCVGGEFSSCLLSTWKTYHCLKSYYVFMDWLSISLECKLHWRLVFSL